MAELGRDLNESCRILPTEVMIAFITNDKSDWSFGKGEAQYLTVQL